MGLEWEVPFARQSGYESSPVLGRGFESTNEGVAEARPPLKPDRDAAPSSQQMARAEDLFLRGALTPEQLERAKQTRRGFESVIGKSNFLPAVFLEIGAVTSRATCQLRTSGVDYLGRSGSWTGTGFLLGPSILVTNNHVLNTPDVAEAGEAVFNYQVGVDGRPLTSKSFRLSPQRLFLTSPARGGMDYTFVWVEGEPGREFGTVPVRRSAFAIAEEEFANVISHPDGRMKEISVQQNEVQWQDHAVVHYTSDTEPGSSGASVCNNNWQLVALHHASKPSNVPKYPVLNEGIKLSAIAADLERILTLPGEQASAARTILSFFDGTDEELGFFGSLGRDAKDASGMEAVVQNYRGTDRDIDVGFWNVEWLTKHYDTKSAAVARVMKEFNLDVWCLEESSPSAADNVVAELSKLGLSYETMPAEPASADGKQSCTLLWNTATSSCQQEDWGPTINEWLSAKSRDFDDLDLGLEAVHGNIFDRYPALFKFTSSSSDDVPPIEFYLVPVHLKAMAEGSLRRRMASKILAAAVKKKIEEGAGKDWIIGGDFNAELATDDFEDLTSHGMTAASAADEASGAFSYIKGPRSLIDHIFLSPNLSSQFGEDDYFIIAAEKSFPNYVAEISDHRPVLLRMSMGRGGAVGGDEVGRNSDALQELKTLLAEVTVAGFEAKRKKKAKRRVRRSDVRISDYEDRQGYDARFLGADGFEVPCPALGMHAKNALVVDKSKSDGNRHHLNYTHFSVAMHQHRCMAIYTAVNVDGANALRIPRKGDRWYIDPRIDAKFQLGNELYSKTISTVVIWCAG